MIFAFSSKVSLVVRQYFHISLRRRSLGTMAESVIPDFKPGPLDVYRKKASFDWKKLKVFLESEDIVKYQNEIYNALDNHQEFSEPYKSRNFEEQRYAVFRQSAALNDIDEVRIENIVPDLRRGAAVSRILISLSPCANVKRGVADLLFRASISNMGTGRHAEFIDQSAEGKISGCYCLTEIGHGSNARGMRTTATYDKKKKVFVLNSPDFQAAKCWAGNLGQTATHGTVYAQLIIDGVKYGLHAFVVPIRNPNTLIPYPGLAVGDMGEKIGLNGIDNGFLQFFNYEIPRENLLNKLADVSEDGRYVTTIKDPNKRHGAALGSLSSGRVNITTYCEALGIKALTIAIRYAAVRKQFGPSENEEVPILEYQSHQNRLLPYLAAAYVIRIFNDYLSLEFYQFTIEAMMNQSKPNAPEMGMEIHAISSACKPVAGWIMRDAIQECREACGGHGYLKVAGIGDIRNDFDANLTYEGENHVLIQQTANYLLKLWPQILKREKISSPMNSIDFLTNSLDILARSRLNVSGIEEMSDPSNIIKTYQWLVCYLLKRTYEKLEQEIKSGKSEFWAKNDTQVYYAKTLSIAYIQHFFFQRMLIKTQQATDPSIKHVLARLFSLYGLYSLEKHIPLLYEGGYAVGPQLTTFLQEGILKICAEIKDDAVALVDAVAPPDFLLKSVLGASDGNVYEHLQQAIYQSPFALNRPRWWREIVGDNDLKHKL